MGREEYENSANIGIVVVVGMGVVCGLGGLLAPVTGDLDFGTGSKFVDACIGWAGGFFVGIILGLFIYWLVSSSPTDLENRISHGPQLVGENCIFCGKRIGSIAEGEFCSQCRNPVHHRCVSVKGEGAENQCPRCGAPLPAAEQVR